MVFLCVLGGILILIALILLLDVTADASFDGEPRIRIRVLFISVDPARLAKKNAEKKKKPAETKKKPEKEKKRGSVDDLLAFADLIKSIASYILKIASRHLRVRLKRMHIVIGSREADKTALNYARALNAADMLLDFFENNAKFRVSRDISAAPDYLGGKCAFDLRITMTIRVFFLLTAALGTLDIFRKHTKKRIAERNRYHERHAVETNN